MNIFEIFMKVRDIFASQWPTMLVVIVFCLIVIISYKFRKIPIYEYPLKDCIMTPAEFKFFEILLMAVDKRYHVFPQVHLDSILNYKYLNEKIRFGGFRHINQKSIDFLLCDLVNAKPLLAIELDDWRHDKWESVKKQDKEKERVLKEAGLPLFRIKVSSDYNRTELAQEIENKIKTLTQTYVRR